MKLVLFKIDTLFNYIIIYQYIMCTLNSNLDEGRLITAEFPTFYLVTTYVPNAGKFD